MPNWKSYESSVRLLSAIVAAHPNLKLDYGAVATKYGQGATGKAISTRFERIRREFAWDLSVNREAGSSAPNSTPRKHAPKVTPKKNKQSFTSTNDDDEDDDEEDFGETPSKKKSVLNKVQGGRVEKNGGGGSGRGRKAANKVQSYAEEEDDDEDAEQENGIGIKDEYAVHAHGNGNGHAHAHAHAYAASNGNGYGGHENVDYGYPTLEDNDMSYDVGNDDEA